MAEFVTGQCPGGPRRRPAFGQTAHVEIRDRNPSDFEVLLRGWLDHAAEEWGYRAVADDDVAAVLQRVPPGVRALVVRGYGNGFIQAAGGYRFTLRGLPSGKGPYAWVGKDSRGVPAIHWEYLVQAAEYVRVCEATSGGEWTVMAEDRLMDITVSGAHGVLFWYLEIKEKASEVPALVELIRAYGHDGVADDAPDRGNDPLRKAKYLVRYRPEYFSVSAIGIRMDFRVEFGEDRTFNLVEDMVPIA